MIEAQANREAKAVLLVQQFVPKDPAAGWGTEDDRNWPIALQRNANQFQRFFSDFKEAGAASREIEWVEGGRRLEVIKVESPI